MAKKRPSAKTHPAEQAESFPQLRLHFIDDVQERYEIARPLLLGQPVTAVARAAETDTHAQTVRSYVRRFEREGMRGLFDEREVLSRGRSVPDIVIEEVLRLKALYPPLHHRELANILYARSGCRIDHKTVATIVRAHPPAIQYRLPLPGLREVKEPLALRVEVIKLYYEGWNIQSISGFLGISRQHIYTLLQRFEEKQFAGLVPRSHAPHYPQRKLNLPVLKKILDLQHEYPYIGRFNMWALLKRQGITDLGQTTVGRAMAFHRFAYAELTREEPIKPPRAHPFKSRTWHQFWFIDHRYLVKIGGIQYYSLCILEGYSRAFLSGIVLATQTRGPVLKVLHETIALWGAPNGIVSDRGGAFISTAYQRTCKRLGIDVHYIEPHQSWQNMIETHFNIQRQLGDYQFEQARSEAALQQAHTNFMEVYNSREHQAHQKRKVGSRTPEQVLSWVRGQPVSARRIQQAFRELLWTRTINAAGYVLVQNYYLYAERALNRQRVCLWLWDDKLRIDHQDELLAIYPCVYDAQQHHIQKVGEPTLHENRFAHQQPQLLELPTEQWQRISQRAPLRRRMARSGNDQLRLPGIDFKK